MDMTERRNKQDPIDVYTLDDSFEILTALQHIALKTCKKKKCCQKKRIRKEKPKVNNGTQKCNDDSPACTDATFRLIPVDIIKSIEVVESHSEAETEESSEW
jgi:phosphorylcholine metabolism protein LicD